MTFFEFIVPVIAFAVAIGGYLILRAQGRRLDGENPPKHPGE
jgi:hypothetical protein